jgi:hypothetical protein
MKSNLDTDLSKADWISYKCTINEVYAQNLYAALCNNVFIKDTDEWLCSWRQSGQIVANLIKEDNRHNKDKWRSGDYLDWYCSGASAGEIPGYVIEGFVTPELLNDLLNLGWNYKPYESLTETDN